MHQNKIGVNMSKLFGQIDINDFLKNYWEKKPLIIKGAIKLPQSLIEKEDLFEMAMDEYFISRMVTKSQSQEWNVVDGPFEKPELEELQTHQWTLINHNLNLYNERIHDLQRSLEFLPSWLFDDAMTTLSNKGSSVGAHIDNYNVFIAQLSGQREWKIQHKPNPKFQEGLPVKILEEFKEDESFILSPGDLIYIPPHVAHHGISLENSLSLSLGFKSIEYDQLLKTMALNILEDESEKSFYKTSFNERLEDTNEIDQNNLKEIKKNLLKFLSEDALLDETILKFASKSKGLFEPNDDFTLEEFEQEFKQKGLILDEFTKFSSIKNNDSIKLGINGTVIHINEEEYSCIKKLQSLLPQTEIHYSKFSKIVAVLYTMFNEGFCYFNVQD